MIRKKNGDERGQALVLFALGLVAFSGLVALSVDAGSVLWSRTQLQAAVDSAALAAAQDLPNTKAAEFVAVDYVKKQLGDKSSLSSTTVEVSFPAADKVKVSVTTDAPAYFARALGIKSLNVSASAVAEATPYSAGSYALFVLKTSCSDSDALEVSGSSITISGRTHSNSNLKVPGSSNKFNAETTYRCSHSTGGSGNTYSPPAAQNPDAQASPLDRAEYDKYLANRSLCTYSTTSSLDLKNVNSLWVNNNPSSKQLKPGVICATGKITIGEQGATGKVTLISASELSLGDSDIYLTAYLEPVVGYSARKSDPGIDVSGSNSTYNGCLFAPDAQIKIAGSSNFSLNGCVVGWRIQVSGSGYNIKSNDAYFPSLPAIKLIE